MTRVTIGSWQWLTMAFLGGLALQWACPSVAFGQDDDVSPVGQTATAPSLNVSGSGAAGVTDTGTTLQQPGIGTDFWGNFHLAYFLPGRRTTFSADVGSAVRTFPVSGAWTAPNSHAARAGVTYQLKSRLRAFAGAGVSFSPTYQVGVLGGLSQFSAGQIVAPVPSGGGIGNGSSIFANDPSAAVGAAPSGGNSLGQFGAPALAAGVTAGNTWIMAGNVGLAYQLSALSSLSVSQGLGRVDMRGQDFDALTSTTSVNYHRSVSRGFGFYVRYSHDRTDQYGTNLYGGVHHGNNVNFGVDYNGGRSISLTPRTTLGFRFGVATVERVNGANGNVNNGLTYQGVGGVNLDHQIGRNWNVGVAYDHDLGFVDGFASAFQTDAVTTGIGGALSRRVGLQGNVVYLRGSGIGLTGPGSQYESYRGVAQLQMAWTRHVWAYTDYFYYRNVFGGQLLTVAGATPQLHRQGVRAGLSFSASLLGGRRTTIASR